VADDDDDLFDTVNKLADRYKLKGKERSSFVHEHMTAGGYDAVPNYVKKKNGDDDDEGGSRFFGGKGGRRRRDDDDGW
jgi:hypothetical protein